MNKENILEILSYPEKNSPPLENCLECGEKLSYEWVSQKNLKEMKGEIAGKPANWWTQIWGGFCSKCEKSEKGNFYARLVFKDEKIKDISPELEQEYQPERKLIRKIASTLLPNQKLKIRFTENYGVGVMDFYGGTSFYEDPQTGWEVLNICFPIELLNDREKDNPGILCEAIAYNLASVSKEVFKNPDRPHKNMVNCGCKKIISTHHSETVPLEHEKGEGYDKIWHDKFNEFRERIKSEKLAESSGYTALGKEFILRDNLPRSVWGPDGEIIAIKEFKWENGKKGKKNDFTDRIKGDKDSPSSNNGSPEKTPKENEEKDKKNQVSPQTNSKNYLVAVIIILPFIGLLLFGIVRLRKKSRSKKRK